MKENKVTKLLEKAFNASDKNENETILTIYSNGEEGNVMFTGDEHDVAEGLAHIIRGGASKKADKNQKALMNALLNAIMWVLGDGGEEADTFATLLKDSIESAQKRVDETKNARELFKHVRDENRHAPADFNPHDKDCLECEDYKECALLWLRDKMRSALAESKKKGNKAKKHGKHNHNK